MTCYEIDEVVPVIGTTAFVHPLVVVEPDRPRVSTDASVSAPLHEMRERS